MSQPARRHSAYPADERGVALPMAMLALLLLSALVLGFSTLAATEPPIANSQLMVSQARALAEAGIERAVWAIGTGNITSPAGKTAAAPYDGSQLIQVSVGAVTLGGFRVTVANPAPPATGSACRSAAERCITSVGWVPGDVTTKPTAHQKIVLAMTNPQALFKDPPAALSVRGQLQMAGHALVDSRGDQGCGRKVGAMTTGAATLQGTAGIFGAMDGNDTPNQLTSAHNGPIPSGAGDVVTSVAASAFDQYAWTDDDINVLRAYAKRHGTYRQGTVRFDANSKMPDGVVFVDTLSGANVTREGVTPATPSSDLAHVSVGSDAPANPDGYHGWLFVNGSLSIAGNFAMRGLIYAQGDLAYHGIGASGVSGAVISRNILDLSTTSIDSDPMGVASITYDCHDARTGGGTIPASWTIKSGTYRELCDSCS